MYLLLPAALEFIQPGTEMSTRNREKVSEE
jgi:hypothetical protein